VIDLRVRLEARRDIAGTWGRRRRAKRKLQYGKPCASRSDTESKNAMLELTKDSDDVGWIMGCFL
jgi:hypothetical protein